MIILHKNKDNKNNSDNNNDNNNNKDNDNNKDNNKLKPRAQDWIMAIEPFNTIQRIEME